MEFSFVAQDPNLYLSNEEKTLRIIQYIQNLRISFRDFLVVAFLSDNTTIEAYVNKFYGNDGPQAITKCWDRLFYSHKWGYNGSFQAAIIDAVIRRSKRDLRRITKAGAFRCPSNKVTRDYFDTFSLRTIESELERYAPCLTNVLRGLQGTRLSHQGVFVPVMGAMVCYNHSNKSNTVQLKMALSLYTVGCPKRAMNSLNALGLTASYTTVYKALRALTQDRMTTIQQLAQTMPIIILSDNLNWIDGVHHQLLNNPSIVRNTTTVTIVIGKELGDDLHGPVEQPHIRHLLTGGNDNNHSEEGDDGNEDAFCPVARFYLFDVLQKSHEPYRMFVTAFKIPDGTLLGSTPTLAFEIGLLDIDQSTVSGNIQVIEHMQELLDLPKEFFETRKLGLVGDLLTISRFHSAKQRRASEIDSLPSDRWEWAVPIFGLFHFQMTVVKVILRTHYGSHDTPGSLAYNISLLGRKRIDPNVKFYHDAKELLISSFYAMVRRIWLVMMGKTDSTSGLGEGLEEMRRDLGDDGSQVEERLTIMAKAIYDTYFVRHSVLLDTLCPADVNAALFIRDMVVYLELCAAIKHGDIKRLQAILKPLTIMMSAGGSPHYALELLRMHYGVRYAWTKLRTEAIFSSMLMNTKGEEDSFIPLDLYQEFNNKLVKECIKRQGSNRSMESLKNVTTPNIRLLDTIATNLEDELGVPFNSAFHRTMSADDDIRTLINSLIKYDILSGEVRPKAINSDEVIVKNLMDVGLTKLITGGFDHFLERVEREDCSFLLREIETGIAHDSVDTFNYLSSLIPKE